MLTKGPKFALSSAVNEKTKQDITINFCRLANELRWKEHWKRQAVSPNSNFPRYPIHSELSQPPRYPDFERKLYRINESITNTLKGIDKRPMSNLTYAEKHTLASLKKKNVVCLPSDKGGEFCVIESDTYAEVGFQHLNDGGTYERVPSITAKTIEQRVNTTWRNVARSKDLPVGVTRTFVTNNSYIAKFYYLVKTHKTGPEIKIRPIVSGINCPTTKLSWLLDKILKPLLTCVSAHLESTSQLVSRLSSLSMTTLEDFPYPCSLDAISLFTSIQPSSAIDAVAHIINERGYSFHGLVTSDICQLLHVILQNNYFTFLNITYKQIQGLAMGGSVSAILAIVYMHVLETKALSTLVNRTGMYCRYVDDIFVLCRNREEAESIRTTFNSIDPNIKFELEHPNENNELKLLDLAIRIDPSGKFSFDFYRKEQKKPLFVNYRAALPTSSKMHYIRNERNRIVNNCSSEQNANKHLAKFESVLRLNNYPPGLLKNAKKHNKSDVKNADGIAFSYFNFPFISDSINNKINRYFRREGLHVRLSHKTTSLRSALASRKNSPKVCRKKDCCLDGSLCFRRNVIYSIVCGKCNQQYIGSTIRDLHSRVHEHFNTASSSVHKHMQHCSSSVSDMTVTVLDKEYRPGNLRIREALYIEKLKPAINNKLESCIDLILF